MGLSIDSRGGGGTNKRGWTFKRHFYRSMMFAVVGWRLKPLLAIIIDYLLSPSPAGSPTMNVLEMMKPRRPFETIFCDQNIACVGRDNDIALWLEWIELLTRLFGMEARLWRLN